MFPHHENFIDIESSFGNNLRLTLRNFDEAGSGCNCKIQIVVFISPKNLLLMSLCPYPSASSRSFFSDLDNNLAVSDIFFGTRENMMFTNAQSLVGWTFRAPDDPSLDSLPSDRN